jgi:hypothetical protein
MPLDNVLHDTQTARMTNTFVVCFFRAQGKKRRQRLRGDETVGVDGGAMIRRVLALGKKVNIVVRPRTVNKGKKRKRNPASATTGRRHHRPR